MITPYHTAVYWISELAMALGNQGPMREDIFTIVDEFPCNLLEPHVHITRACTPFRGCLLAFDEQNQP